MSVAAVGSDAKGLASGRGNSTAAPAENPGTMSQTGSTGEKPRTLHPQPGNVKRNVHDHTLPAAGQQGGTGSVGTTPRAGPATRVLVSKLSVADRKEFVRIWKLFGPKMIAMHEAWHQQNGSGGTMGPGSGERFMQFHANLMRDFGALLAKENPGLWDRLGKKLPKWDTTAAIPKEFYFPTMLATAKGAKGIDWKVPGYLTATGGGETFTLSDGGSAKTIRSLNDIDNPDELGRVLGKSGAHAVGHVRCGGQMSQFSSIGTPVFVLWHGGPVEEIREAWLQTAKGKAWAQRFPPEGWMDNLANAHQRQSMPLDAARAAPVFSETQLQAEMEALARQQPRASKAR